jgi:WD40 repeat protein
MLFDGVVRHLVEAPGHHWPQLSSVLSSDGKVIVRCYRDVMIRFWPKSGARYGDIQDNVFLFSKPHLVSPCDQFIVSCSVGGTINTWNKINK